MGELSESVVFSDMFMSKMESDDADLGKILFYKRHVDDRYETWHAFKNAF